MQKLIILNTREIKKIKVITQNDFGYSLKSDYAYLRNDKNRIFLVNKDLGRLDIDKLKIDKIGLYFAEVKHNHVRLSKEGSQLLAKEAEKNEVTLKNVVELSEKEMKDYFQGLDLEKDLGDDNKFILLKYNQEIFGCAKYKEKKILNFLPKIHRGEVII